MKKAAHKMIDGNCLKEKDLILAAELGKALLEKNEELSEANEKMADEFSKRLEVKIFILCFFVVVFL